MDSLYWRRKLDWEPSETSALLKAAKSKCLKSKTSAFKPVSPVAGVSSTLSVAHSMPMPSRNSNDQLSLNISTHPNDVYHSDPVDNAQPLGVRGASVQVTDVAKLDAKYFNTIFVDETHAMNATGDSEIKQSDDTDDYNGNGGDDVSYMVC